MKATLIACVEAYLALATLTQQPTDYKTACTLLTLKRALQGQVQFFQQEERKLADKYAMHDEKGKIVWRTDTSFAFADPAQAPDYARERGELCEVIPPEEFPELSIKPPEQITAAQLEALEPFLTFKEEGGK